MVKKKLACSYFQKFFCSSVILIKVMMIQMSAFVVVVLVVGGGGVGLVVNNICGLSMSLKVFLCTAYSIFKGTVSRYQPERLCR